MNPRLAAAVTHVRTTYAAYNAVAGPSSAPAPLAKKKKPPRHPRSGRGYGTAARAAIPRESEAEREEAGERIRRPRLHDPAHESQLPRDQPSTSHPPEPGLHLDAVYPPAPSQPPPAEPSRAKSFFARLTSPTPAPSSPSSSTSTSKWVLQAQFFSDPSSPSASSSASPTTPTAAIPFDFNTATQPQSREEFRREAAQIARQLIERSAQSERARRGGLSVLASAAPTALTGGERTAAGAGPAGGFPPLRGTTGIPLELPMFTPNVRRPRARPKPHLAPESAPTPTASSRPPSLRPSRVPPALSTSSPPISSVQLGAVPPTLSSPPSPAPTPATAAASPSPSLSPFPTTAPPTSPPSAPVGRERTQTHLSNTLQLLAARAQSFTQAMTLDQLERPVAEVSRRSSARIRRKHGAVASAKEEEGAAAGLKNLLPGLGELSSVGVSESASVAESAVPLTPQRPTEPGPQEGRRTLAERGSMLLAELTTPSFEPESELDQSSAASAIQAPDLPSFSEPLNTTPTLQQETIYDARTLAALGPPAPPPQLTEGQRLAQAHWLATLSNTDPEGSLTMDGLRAHFWTERTEELHEAQLLRKQTEAREREAREREEEYRRQFREEARELARVHLRERAEVPVFRTKMPVSAVDHAQGALDDLLGTSPSAGVLGGPEASQAQRRRFAADPQLVLPAALRVLLSSLKLPEVPPKPDPGPARLVTQQELDAYLRPLYSRGWSVAYVRKSASASASSKAKEGEPARGGLPLAVTRPERQRGVYAHALLRKFGFRNTVEAWRFGGKVLEVTERENHHPVLSIFSKTVYVRTHTHSALTFSDPPEKTRGITMHDVRFAYLLEAIDDPRPEPIPSVYETEIAPPEGPLVDVPLMPTVVKYLHHRLVPVGQDEGGAPPRLQERHAGPTDEHGRKLLGPPSPCPTCGGGHWASRCPFRNEQQKGGRPSLNMY